ncbi:hypothetical protein COV18_03780 [Candidatus Woesearchaeota archaeon CG10_big_fil_rev_8_21_14_0_10_37_12]|nr:MAG: hypothetical protein COV18_03780 [Candidatus Woesearchaeota archaeon CG10_big_fil_rev_8_21_14_0_10_37_12]
MTKENYKILIVEDNAEYRTVAETAVRRVNRTAKMDGLPEFSVTYAPDFSSAIITLEKQKYDGVISDLFFPFGDSEGSAREHTSWIKTICEQIKPGIDEMRASLDGCSDNFRESLEKMCDAADRGYALLSGNMYEGEFPHGFGVANYCKDRNVPVVIVSQGERHAGKLGYIRYALDSLPEDSSLCNIESLLYKGVAPNTFGRRSKGLLDARTLWDPTEQENETDKLKVQTWLDALAHTTSPLREILDKSWIGKHIV